MRVVLHSLTYDVGHLVVATIVNHLHSVQDTALHRLQSIVHVRHGTLQYNIRGVIQEPVLIHTRQTANALLGHQAVILTGLRGNQLLVGCHIHLLDYIFSLF